MTTIKAYRRPRRDYKTWVTDTLGWALFGPDERSEPRTDESVVPMGKRLCYVLAWANSVPNCRAAHWAYGPDGYRSTLEYTPAPPAMQERAWTTWRLLGGQIITCPCCGERGAKR